MLDDEDEVAIKPEDDIDCQGTPDVVCPWCGYEHEHGSIHLTDDNIWREDPLEEECSNCGRPFQVYVHTTIDYTSYRDHDALKKREEEEAERARRPPPQPIEELTYKEWIAEGQQLFGIDMERWRFRCPICGNTYTREEMLKAYQTLYQCDWETAQEETAAMVGLTCMGRISNTEGCDYTLGGLFKVCRREVTTPDGKQHPVFEFATEDHKVPHRKAF